MQWFFLHHLDRSEHHGKLPVIFIAFTAEKMALDTEPRDLLGSPSVALLTQASLPASLTTTVVVKPPRRGSSTRGGLTGGKSPTAESTLEHDIRTRAREACWRSTGPQSDAPGVHAFAMVYSVSSVLALARFDCYFAAGHSASARKKAQLNKHLDFMSAAMQVSLE